MNDLRTDRLHVLLLEDSEFDAELLHECLRAHYPQVTVRLASTEDEFVTAVTQGQFDLILSDHELPGFSGAQALRHAHSLTPHTPFIFVSGVIGEENAVEMLKRGATDYVSKGRLSRLPVVVDRALREVAERQARDHAESQLREANAVYARVVDTLRDYAVILLDGAGLVKGWNRGAQEIFGFEAAQMLGRSAAFIFTPEDREQRVFESELREAHAQGKANCDRWLVRADGTRLWAEGVVIPLHGDGGEHTGFCKFARDATTAHQDAQALRTAKEEAEQANRAKDRFLAVLSHELRTPLAPIDSAAYLLERCAMVPEKYQSLLPMIRRNVALEARLIDDLLDLTAISAGKIALHTAPVDMHQLLHGVVEMVGTQIRDKGLRLDLDLQAGSPIVQADEARMQQVLWNIVRNAVKFTPEGGHITLRSESDGPSFSLHCIDTGIGIEPAALPRIFSAFEQADSEVSRRFGGLGLGLAIAKGLVAEHQGTLTVSSDGRGKGATFTLTLECFDAGRAAPSGSDGLMYGPERQRSGCRLLLVEDNIDAADAMALSLESFGYEVTHVMTCADALKAARESRFDVVVTDLGLPDGSGIDVGRELSASSPVIALSGYGTEQDHQRSALAGFSGHLTKPVDPDGVHEMVQKVLVQRARAA